MGLSTKVLRALVVSGSSGSRRRIREILEASSFDCVDARNGLDALRFASPHGIDLIVIDADLAESASLGLLTSIGRGAFGGSPPPIVACSDYLSGGDFASRSNIILPRIQIIRRLHREELVNAIALALSEARD